MKKSQRLRLAELLGRKNNGTLNPGETAELSQLEALASQHPDAAQDVDDTAAAKPLSPVDFMAKMTAAFTAKAELAAENTRLRSGNVGDVSLVAVLGALKIDAAALAGQSAEQIAAAILAPVAAAESAKTAAESAKATAEASLADARAALSAVATAVGLKPAELAGKPAAEIQTAFNARIEARSGERLAEVGFPVGGLPPSAAAGSASGSGDELADVQEQLRTTKDPVQAGILAAKANALRDRRANATGAGRN